MTAIDTISSSMTVISAMAQDCGVPVRRPGCRTGADTPLLDALPLLLDSPDRRLGVEVGGDLAGVVTERSMLEALGRLIVPRDDSSVITVECPASDYSASALAMAVEDADVHLVDLISRPGEGDTLLVTLRVRTTEPENVISSLERHGYTVIYSGEHHAPVEAILSERIAALQAMLNI